MLPARDMGMENVRNLFQAPDKRAPLLKPIIYQAQQSISYGRNPALWYDIALLLIWHKNHGFRWILLISHAENNDRLVRILMTRTMFMIAQSFNHQKKASTAKLPLSNARLTLPGIHTGSVRLGI